MAVFQTADFIHSVPRSIWSAAEAGHDWHPPGPCWVSLWDSLTLPLRARACACVFPTPTVPALLRGDAALAVPLPPVASLENTEKVATGDT